MIRVSLPFSPASMVPKKATARGSYGKMQLLKGMRRRPWQRLRGARGRGKAEREVITVMTSDVATTEGSARAREGGKSKDANSASLLVATTEGSARAREGKIKEDKLSSLMWQRLRGVRGAGSSKEDNLSSFLRLVATTEGSGGRGKKAQPVINDNPPPVINDNPPPGGNEIGDATVIR